MDKEKYIEEINRIIIQLLKFEGSDLFESRLRSSLHILKDLKNHYEMGKISPFELILKKKKNEEENKEDLLYGTCKKIEEYKREGKLNTNLSYFLGSPVEEKAKIEKLYLGD